MSTNIVHAQDWTVNPEKHVQSRGGGTTASDPGSVIVCAIPDNFPIWVTGLLLALILIEH